MANEVELVAFSKKYKLISSLKVRGLENGQQYDPRKNLSRRSVSVNAEFVCNEVVLG